MRLSRIERNRFPPQSTRSRSSSHTSTSRKSCKRTSNSTRRPTSFPHSPIHRTTQFQFDSFVPSLLYATLCLIPSDPLGQLHLVSPRLPFDVHSDQSRIPDKLVIQRFTFTSQRSRRSDSVQSTEEGNVGMESFSITGIELEWEGQVSRDLRERRRDSRVRRRSW